jgi:hypothetical protein
MVPLRRAGTGDPFDDDVAIDDAISQAGRDARLRHKQLGVPLVMWRDGKVVEIPPEEIVVDPSPQAAPSD